MGLGVLWCQAARSRRLLGEWYMVKKMDLLSLKGGCGQWHRVPRGPGPAEHIHTFRLGEGEAALEEEGGGCRSAADPSTEEALASLAKST